MLLRLALASAASLAVYGPALAQDAAPAAPAASAATPAVSEAEVEAAGEAFGQKMEAMGQELAAAVTAANGDMARARADTDPIVAKYQPDADAFADLLGRFFTSMSEGPEKAQASAMAPMIVAQIKGIPAQARDAALAPPAAAQAPATPQ